MTKAAFGRTAYFAEFAETVEQGQGLGGSIQFDKTPDLAEHRGWIIGVDALGRHCVKLPGFLRSAQGRSCCRQLHPVGDGWTILSQVSDEATVALGIHGFPSRPSQFARRRTADQFG